MRYQLSETEEAEVHQFARGQTSMLQRELQVVVLALQQPYTQQC